MAASFLSRRRRALQAADELLTDLGADQSKPIDVFGAIDQLGLWLVFQPLRTLLGAVVPKGDGGIMLTTQRGAAVQRYTAAHEIGHWTLDLDQVAMDTEDDVFRPSAERERGAQLFASYFLLPPPLVYDACSRHDITKDDRPTGAQVYLAARDMGVSYEAALRQLNNLEIIDYPQLSQLLTLTPASIKAELCAGHRPSGPVDVWPLDPVTPRQQIAVTSGDEIFIALPENRTTGYQWLTDNDVAARAHRTPAPSPQRVASPPTRGTAEARITGAGRPRPLHDVRASLAQLPGNRGHRRTLPAAPIRPINTPPTADPATNDLPAEEELASATQPVAASLSVIDDRYRPGWAAIAPNAARNVRRYIAGQRGVTLPDQLRTLVNPVEPPIQPQQLEPRARDDHEAAGTHPFPAGGTGLRLVALRADGEGERSWVLHYSSTSDPNAAGYADYRIDVTITANPEIQHRRELLDLDLDAADDRDGGHP